MKRIFAIAFFSLMLLNCSDDEVTIPEEGLCTTLATVRDYRGLDGCDFVLELIDGTILEPVKMTVCGPAPQSTMTLEDPLANVRTDGTTVIIDYEETSGGSICMVGQLVKITCLTIVSSPSEFSTGN